MQKRQINVDVLGLHIEYQPVAQSVFFQADGMVRFGRLSWILQQDGAKIHTTAASSMVEVMQGSNSWWPPALARRQINRELCRMQPCTTFEELRGTLQVARSKIIPASLQHLFEMKSVPRRLANCIEKGDDAMPWYGQVLNFSARHVFQYKIHYNGRLDNT